MTVCCITIDTDMIAVKNGSTIFVDEFQYCFDSIQAVLREFKKVKTTWFIRVDRNMQEIYGRADYIFSAHAEKIAWLRENGHQLAWHIHSYRNENGGWVQNTDTESVLEEVREFYPLAQKLGIADTVRIGWASQSNELMNLLKNLGCKIESSAIPRPHYNWANQYSDWSSAPNSPYYPSKENYQLAGEEAEGMLEIPMTTAVISASYDNGQMIYRYVNPAYHSDVFQKAMTSLKGNCVLLLHPCEVSSVWDCSHELISYNAGVFRGNIEKIYDSFDFLTLKQLAPVC